MHLRAPMGSLLGATSCAVWNKGFVIQLFTLVLQYLCTSSSNKSLRAVAEFNKQHSLFREDKVL